MTFSIATDRNFEVFLMREGDVQVLKRSDVIYIKNQTNLHFLSLAIKTETAKTVKFDEPFLRPMVYEGPSATPEHGFAFQNNRFCLFIIMRSPLIYVYAIPLHDCL